MPDSPFMSMFQAGGMFDPAAMRQQKAYDMLGGMGAALLQASAPTFGPPRGFLDVLGTGLVGANQAAQSGEDKYLRRALTGAQVAQAQSQLQQDQAFRDLLIGAGASSAPGMPAPAPAAPPPAAPQPLGPIASPTPDPNNIGNVRPVGASTGFQTAADLPAGINMAVNNARAYPKAFNNGQPMNLIQIGERWAPKGDGANDPRQWAMNVAQIGGLDPMQPLDLNNPEIAAKFARGVHGAEKGSAAALPLPTYLAAINGQPVAQGDGSGNPVQQAQFQPPQPKTLAEVVQTIPPGVRQMIGAMGRKDGLPLLLKYADPETTPAIDIQTGQVVFAPKTQLNSGRYQPIDAARLGMEGQRLEMDKRARAVDEANRDVTIGPAGPQINQQVVDAKKAVSAAQGTDPAGKMLTGDYDDARKANTEIQSGALLARTGMAQMKRLGQLLEGIDTGRFAATSQEIQKIAKGLGIDIGDADKIGQKEAATALANQISLTLRNPSSGAGMPGAMSDADRNFLRQMVPGLETTAQGRKMMLDFANRMYQRQVDVARISNDFMRSPEAKKDPNALYQKLQEYAEKNPLFSESDIPAGGMSPMPSSGPAAPSGAPAPPAGFKVIGR